MMLAAIFYREIRYLKIYQCLLSIIFYNMQKSSTLLFKVA